MGVPSFYKWLVKKYPNIVRDASEENMNDGLEFDHLYLDMNGIIHPCFHPEDTVFPPITYEDVFDNVCEYIDKLFNIVRPRKLLFLAIDGVAPRAKMNQQRARRFRAAKDSENYDEVEKRLRKQFEMEGKEVLPRVESQLSDSNIITPGSEFMFLLSKKLQCFIELRMTNDSRWKNIKVILSDANVPGEGEHKVMSFIRAQRCSKDYDPNTRHCLYGLDADLIMLALATHEVHFSILREDVLVQEEKVNSTSEFERSSNKCRGWFKQAMDKKESALESCHSEVASGKSKVYDKIREKFGRASPITKTSFQFLNVWLLREYLDIEMCISGPPENVKFDLERIIDDFIFICFFTGNDFLPHMPTLEIHEGAIDLLMHVYKNEFNKLGGYLVDVQRIEDRKNGFIKLKRVEKFILSVGEYEEKIFKKRTEIRERQLRKVLSDQAKDGEAEDHDWDPVITFSNSVGTYDSFRSEKESAAARPSSDFGEKGSSTDISELVSNTKELKQKVKDRIRHESDAFRNGLNSDKVKLASPGFKQRYYEVKFSARSKEEIESARKALVQKYTEGLLWVLKYYFSGVPSWNWFYPYHYGPFASDLKGLAQVKVNFQKGLPLKPYDQLLAVLPPESVDCVLPDAYRKLIKDNDSGIADFYPTSFQMDFDGKRFMWQGICKLPFIEEDRLLKAAREAEKELKQDEIERNAETSGRLFVGRSECLVKQITEVYRKHCSPVQNDGIKINIELGDGFTGVLHFPEENDGDGLASVLCLYYKLSEDCDHKHHLLEGVKIPEKTITEADIVATTLWHESSGDNTYRNRFQKEKEPDIIHKGAGVGWGRGGRCGQFQTVQSAALKSSGVYPTPASSLNLSLEKKCNVNASGNSWGRWRNSDEGSWTNSNTRTASSAGSWQSRETSRAGTGWMASRPISSANSAGSWQSNATSSANTAWMPSRPSSSANSVRSWQSNATSRASTAWMPSRPISSGSDGQQSYFGRGQSTTSWNTRNRQGNNYQ